MEAIAPHEEATGDPLPDANVVVIGAGMSGLAAASHLVKNRVVNTTVLEASPRYHYIKHLLIRTSASFTMIC